MEASEDDRPNVVVVLLDDAGAGDAGALGAQRYNMMVVDKHVDKPALGAQIRALGGRCSSRARILAAA